MHHQQQPSRFPMPGVTSPAHHWAQARPQDYPVRGPVPCQHCTRMVTVTSVGTLRHVGEV